MHLMFVDESGTHGGSKAMVLGGLAVHESHMPAVQKSLSQVLRDGLAGRNVDPEDFELHAAEIRSPNNKKRSPWKSIPSGLRGRILKEAYKALESVRCGDDGHGCGLFGVAMDARFRAYQSQYERDQYAYEVLLNKFDNLLAREEPDGLGLVIHDQRLVVEKDVREWTRGWQEAAGQLAQLKTLADVPLFADSRATRLLQGADLVAYALWRYYHAGDESRVGSLWSQFDFKTGHMHGVIHLTPQYKQCACPPCTRRSAGDLSEFE